MCNWILLYVDHIVPFCSRVNYCSFSGIFSVVLSQDAISKSSITKSLLFYWRSPSIRALKLYTSWPVCAQYEWVLSKAGVQSTGIVLLLYQLEVLWWVSKYNRVHIFEGWDKTNNNDNNHFFTKYHNLLLAKMKR